MFPTSWILTLLQVLMACSICSSQTLAPPISRTTTTTSPTYTHSRLIPPQTQTTPDPVITVEVLPLSPVSNETCDVILGNEVEADIGRLVFVMLNGTANAIGKGVGQLASESLTDIVVNRASVITTNSQTLPDFLQTASRDEIVQYVDIVLNVLLTRICEFNECCFEQ